MSATTYSFKSVSGAFAHPTVGDFIFAGQIGAGHFTVGYATERAVHDVAADGAIMVSYVAGDNGYLDVEVQQTSLLHQFLLDWFNVIKTAANLGNPALWAAATVSLRDIVTGAVHTLTGVSPSRIPDKPYAAQGSRITWRLMAADVQSA